MMDHFINNNYLKNMSKHKEASKSRWHITTFLRESDSYAF